jgi:hypothetical protein
VRAFTKVRAVGTLSGFAITEVFYSFVPKDDPKAGRFNWKTLLVKIGPDLYVEIYHLQAYYDDSSLTPSKIKRVGSEWVLTTSDTDSGNGGGCWDGYWWFDSSGPHAIDFSAVSSAIAAYVPVGALYSTHCLALKLERQRIHSWVQCADADCHACGSLGHVLATFRLSGWHAIPGVVEFRSEEQ